MAGLDPVAGIGSSGDETTLGRHVLAWEVGISDNGLMPLRVCQIITELRPAGAERMVYELATRLPRERFEVEVMALRGGQVGDALERAGVRVHVLGVRGKLDVLLCKKFGQAVGILRRGRFDLVHTHLFHADMLGGPAAVFAGKIPRLHTVHVVERRFRPWHFAWAGVSAMLPSAREIVCVSQGVRDFHARRTHLPESRYTVIYNGVDIERFSQALSRREAERGRLGLKDEEIACVFVGRLDGQKGIEDLLEAFGRAAEANGRLNLVLAGEGPMRGYVEEKIGIGSLAGRVRLLGFVEDVAGLLAAGDMFLQPSRWEGFCLAAAEAMAAGLAVVATDVAGLNEVVVDGQTGLLCRVGDCEALAGAIVRLAGDAAFRGELGRQGRRRAEEMFSISRCVEEHARLYERAALQKD